MPEASLLTPEVLALVGVRTGPVAVTVTPRLVERTRELFPGLRPVPAVEGAPVPGMILLALEGEAEHVPFPELLPDALLVSNEVWCDRPLRLGETLLVDGALVDLSERFGGRFGYAVTLRSEIAARDAGGAVVARGTRTLMQYDARDERSGDQ